MRFSRPSPHAEGRKLDQPFPHAVPFRRLLFFVLRLLAWYALLMAPWPGLQVGYAALFRAGCGVLFGTFGTYGRVEFHPLDGGEDLADTQVLLVNQKNPGVRGKTTCGSRLRGYYPTAFLTALVLASPVPWDRKWKSLVLGLLLVNLYVALRVWLPVLQAFSADAAQGHYALYDLAPFWDRLIEGLVSNLVKTPVSHFAGPLLIWAAVTFRRGDWARLSIGQ